MNPASSHHQSTGTRPRQQTAHRAATLFSSASHTTHCMPVSVASGTRRRDLRQLRRPETGCDDAGLDGGRRVELVEVAGQRAEPGMVVEVGDRHLRVPRAQRGHQLRRRQRAAAEGEEVGLRPVDRGGEHVAPQPGQPARGAAEVGVVGVVGGAVDGPGQRVAVDLARRPGGQFVEREPAGGPARRAATRPARRGPRPGRSRDRRWRCNRPAAECRWRSCAPLPRRR